ncbi:MAG: hypothetical protein WA659_00865 [Candidatus Aquirickettsiella sp.]
MKKLLIVLKSKASSKTDAVVIQEPINAEGTTQENVSILAQQLRAVKLKSVNRSEIQKEYIQAAKQENGPSVFVMDKAALASIKLNSVNPNNTGTPSPEDKLTELEIKLAKQRAWVEGLNRHQARILSTIIEEEIVNQRNSILPVNEEPTYLDSDNIQKEFQELQDFEKIESMIALQQELEEAEKEFEEAFQNLSKVTPPISAYFKNTSPT